MSSLEKLLRAGPDKATAPALEEATASFVRRADADDLVDVAWTTADSPVGELLLAATPEGLVKVSFGVDDEVLDDLSANLSPRLLEMPSRLDPIRRQLDEYFAGRRHEFDVTVDWSLAHGFRARALEVLAAQVDYGEVVTYKELAERSGNPKAVRAAGSACATNPIPIVVPCHRVVRTGGGLGGYGGGLDAKRLLLTLEGAILA